MAENVVLQTGNTTDGNDAYSNGFMRDGKQKQWLIVRLELNLDLVYFAKMLVSQNGCQARTERAKNQAGPKLYSFILEFLPFNLRSLEARSNWLGIAKALRQREQRWLTSCQTNSTSKLNGMISGVRDAVLFIDVGCAILSNKIKRRIRERRMKSF